MEATAHLSYGEVNKTRGIATGLTSSQAKKELEIALKGLYTPSKVLYRIAVPDNNSLVFINIKDIIRCESVDRYSVIYTKDGRKYPGIKTINEYEDLFVADNFFRVHNVHLINLDFIKRYFKGRGGHIEMEDGSVIEVANRRKDDFLACFNA